MKKLFFTLLTFAFFASSFAQEDYRKRSSLGVNFFLNDFQTASDLRTYGVGNVIRNKNFFKINRMHPGLAVDYAKGIFQNVDFIGTLGGSFVDYPIKNHDKF